MHAWQYDIMFPMYSRDIELTICVCEDTTDGTELSTEEITNNIPA